MTYLVFYVLVLRAVVLSTYTSTAAVFAYTTSVSLSGKYSRQSSVSLAVDLQYFVLSTYTSTVAVLLSFASIMKVCVNVSTYLVSRKSVLSLLMPVSP